MSKQEWKRVWRNWRINRVNGLVNSHRDEPEKDEQLSRKGVMLAFTRKRPSESS